MSSSTTGIMESVMTHEHNDPMLSAAHDPMLSAAVTGPGFSNSVIMSELQTVVVEQVLSVQIPIAPPPSVAPTAVSNNPVSTQLTSPVQPQQQQKMIQLPTEPLPPEPQQQQQQPKGQGQLQPMKTSSISAPVQSIITPPPVTSSSALSYSITTAAAPSAAAPPALAPAAAASLPPQADPPRKDKLTLYGCFVANLACSKAKSKPYVIHVFDKGSYFKSGTEPDPLLMEQLLKGTGVVFDAMYSKINPNRVTFDQVILRLNNQWVVVPKPGTAVKAMEYVEADAVFYLQSTALLKVNLFVQKQNGLPWISGCRFITNTNIQNAIAHADFNVLIAASSKSNSNHRNSTAANTQQPPPPPPPALPPAAATATVAASPSPIGSPAALLPPSTSMTMTNGGTAASVPSPGSASSRTSETLHLKSGTITLHSSGSTGPTQHIKTNATTTQQSPSAGSTIATGKPCDYQLTDAQYPFITLEQSMVCTSCAQCNRRFKYAIENFFHFVMSPMCRNYVLKSRPLEEALTNNNASFSHTLYALIAKQCGLPKDTAFKCNSCLVTIAGPLQYCIHRDQHQPVHGDISLCQFCGIVYRTPHCFYRHKCISSWDLKNTLSKFEKNHLSIVPGLLGEDAFKIYSNLSEDEKSKVLKCPVCSKGLCYMSGLLAHLKSSPECFNLLKQQMPGNLSNECVDLSAYMFQKSGLTPRELKCETCGLESRNQVAYAIHRDHHTLKKQGMLICKGCNSEYRAPCEFYRHNCSSNRSSVTVKLQWCPFCEVARHCDKLRETSSAAARTTTTTVTLQSTTPINAGSIAPVAAFSAAAPPLAGLRPALTTTTTICDTRPSPSVVTAPVAAAASNSEIMKRLLTAEPVGKPQPQLPPPPPYGSHDIIKPESSSMLKLEKQEILTPEDSKTDLLPSTVVAAPGQGQPPEEEEHLVVIKDELEEALRRMHQDDDEEDNSKPYLETQPSSTLAAQDSKSFFIPDHQPPASILQIQGSNNGQETVPSGNVSLEPATSYGSSSDFQLLSSNLMSGDGSDFLRELQPESNLLLHGSAGPTDHTNPPVSNSHPPNSSKSPAPKMPTARKKTTAALRNIRRTRPRSIPMRSHYRNKAPPLFSVAQDYVCTDCDPFRILRGAESMANHCQAMNHYKINPLKLYNKASLRIQDLASGKLGSKVLTEKERIETRKRMILDQHGSGARHHHQSGGEGLDGPTPQHAGLSKKNKFNNPSTASVSESTT